MCVDVAVVSGYAIANPTYSATRLKRMLRIKIRVKKIFGIAKRLQNPATNERRAKQVESEHDKLLINKQVARMELAECGTFRRYDAVIVVTPTLHLRNTPF